MSKQTRGPECIDQPGASLQTYFAEWSWEPDAFDGRVHWVDFRMWKADAWNRYGAPEFADRNQDGDVDLGRMSSHPKDHPPLMSGFRKWDGCTQWKWPQDMHMDESADVEAFFAAVRTTHRIAAEIMGDTWDGGTP